MRTLSFVNQKGGCGKTTAAVQLAAALALSGERTLLVDLDPQAHATLALGVDGGSGTAITDVLVREVELRGALRQAPCGVMLAPANADLGEFEEVAARRLGSERALRRALEPLADEFDYALIDCPARADGVLSSAGLCASDTAVLVIETGAFALQGAVRASKLFEDLSERHGWRFDVRVLGTLYDRRTRSARELLVAMHARFGPRMFDTVIRSSVRLREAAASGVPVQLLDPRAGACEDFASLAAELRHATRIARGTAVPAPLVPL